MVGVGHQGWARGNPDPRDRYYKPRSDTQMKWSVNLSDEYPGCLPWPPYNQFQTDSCVANSSAAALWFEINKDEPGRMGDDGPSRQFIYYNARTIIPDGSQSLADHGTWIRLGMKGIGKRGACSENSWPFGDATSSETITSEVPYQECFDEGLDHVIDSYYRLDPDRASDPSVSGVQQMSEADMEVDGQFVLNNLRFCLSEGYPVVFGFAYYWDQPNWDKSEAIWSLDNPWEEGIATPNQPAPTKSDGSSYGGHAIICIGYDEDRQAVLIQNSWGLDQPNWTTQNGWFWMPYAWITDFHATNDFWTIRRSGAEQGYYTLAEVCAVMNPDGAASGNQVASDGDGYGQNSSGGYGQGNDDGYQQGYQDQYQDQYQNQYQGQDQGGYQQDYQQGYQQGYQQQYQDDDRYGRQY